MQLDRFLFLKFPAVKKTRVRQWLKFRAVAVNGRPAERHDQKLLPGDRVEVRTDKKSFQPARTPSGAAVLFEDETLLAVEKPAGLLTVSTENEKERTLYREVNETLKETTRGRRSPHAFIVHRLDREASGILVFAKTEEAKHFLQKRWDGFEKRYAAVVEGTLGKREGTLESHLHQTGVDRVSSGEEGNNSKWAVTRYRTVKSGKRVSLLEILLETGRKHQIRVQLADTGHPILGDKKYGSGYDPIRRLALHAESLTLKHPVTGQMVTFRSEIPASFFKLVRQKYF